MTEQIIVKEVVDENGEYLRYESEKKSEEK